MFNIDQDHVILISIQLLLQEVRDEISLTRVDLLYVKLILDMNLFGCCKKRNVETEKGGNNIDIL